jgi:L-malate glycosyltransferase
VYIEALSQGLPIIYSKGQGVDGYFSDGEVGYACNPDDLNSIVGCAEKIIKNYSVISKNCFKSLNQFKWQNICRDYEDIYRSVLIS